MNTNANRMCTEELIMSVINYVDHSIKELDLSYAKVWFRLGAFNYTAIAFYTVDNTGKINSYDFYNGLERSNLADLTKKRETIDFSYCSKELTPSSQIKCNWIVIYEYKSE